MKRILYSQNEDIVKDDYFVIDGVVETSNISNHALVAFHLIKSTENWKKIYEDEDLIVRKKGRYLNIKSFYLDKDKSGRSIFYVYYVESNDLLEMLDYLKSDSDLIKKELGLVTEDLVKKIKNGKRKRNFFYTTLILMTLSYIIWKTVR